MRGVAGDDLCGTFEDSVLISKWKVLVSSDLSEKKDTRENTKNMIKQNCHWEANILYSGTFEVTVIYNLFTSEDINRWLRNWLNKCTLFLAFAYSNSEKQIMRLYDKGRPDPTARRPAAVQMNSSGRRRKGKINIAKHVWCFVELHLLASKYWTKTKTNNNSLEETPQKNNLHSQQP